MTRRRLAFVLALGGLIVFATSHSSFAQADERFKVPVTKLVVDPAAAPRPAMRYRLLPEVSEVKPGNAAPFYYRALLDSTRIDANMTREDIENRDTWREMPLDELPKRKVRQFLTRFERVFEELNRATYREECDWDWRLQDMTGREVIHFTLTEAQETRNIARVLALKAHLEIAEGRYDDAINTMQAGYQLARHVADQQIIISSLVGMAIHSIIDGQLEALIAAPDSPNMYWALSALPSPFIDVRDDIEREVMLIPQMFPFLKDAATAERTPEQWRKLLTGTMHALRTENFGSEDEEASAASRWMTLAVVMRGYPAAKQALVDRGYTAAQVDRMPVGQVAAVQIADLNQYITDEFLKWSYQPYPEARNGFRQVHSQLKREGVFGPLGHSRQIIPVTGVLFPATDQALHAAARRDLAIATHRVIEAIRMHAAAHNGALPKSLAAIDIVPVPDDPVTGLPFPYEHKGETAVLTVPTTRPGDSRLGRIYEITIR